MVVVLSEESAVRKGLMAQQQAKDARPAKKFTEGTTLQFRTTFQRYQAAVNIPGLSTKLKMIELSHWFGGIAAELIAAYAMYDDHEAAYDDVVEEICFLFGGNTDSIAPMIREIKAGKPVGEKDHKTHMSFYAELVDLESQARALRQMPQVDNTDTLAEIIEARLPHAANTWWKEELRRQQQGICRQHFGDLKKVVQDTIYILGSRKALTAPLTSKTNATETTTQFQPPQQDQPAQRPSRKQLRAQRLQQKQMQEGQLPQEPIPSYINALKEAPLKEQSTDCCNICGGMHKTETCHTFISKDVDGRVEVARERKLCFKCLNPGHNGRNCPNPPPTCGECNKEGHHTLFHGRKFVKPQQPASLSVNAMSFQPASNVAPAPTPTTTESGNTGSIL